MSTRIFYKLSQIFDNGEVDVTVGLNSATLAYWGFGQYIEEALDLYEGRAPIGPVWSDGDSAFYLCAYKVGG